MGFVWQYSTPQGCLVISQRRMAAATTKTKYSTCSFSLQSYEDARLPLGRQSCCEAAEGTQGVRTTSVSARTYVFCPLPPDNRATTLRFIARLPQESYEPYDYLWSLHHCRTAALATVLQLCKHILRQLCAWTQDEHRTDVLRLVKIYLKYVILSAISHTSWRLRQIARQSERTIDVKQV